MLGCLGILLLALGSALNSFAAASFTALPFTDPFPPAATAGAYSQPPGTVLLNENLSGVALPITRQPAGMNQGFRGMTIEWWLKQKPQGTPISSNPDGTIVHGPGFAVNADWQWGGGPGAILANFSQNKAGQYVGSRGVAISLQPSDEQWHHYVVTYDLRTVRAYRDGELIEQKWLDNNTDRIGPYEDDSGAIQTSVIEIGGGVTTGGRRFQNGYLESMRISSVCLTPYQVKKNFENARSYAKTLYVAPNGAGSGTVAAPMSLASAMAQVGARTRIILQPGTYNGADFQVNGSGASPRDHCLIIGADGASPALIQGGAPRVSGGYITLRNLTFSSDAASALTINNAPKSVAVDSCRFSSAQSGLAVYNSAKVYVQNCVANGATGLYFSGSPDSVVRNNTIVGGTVGVQYDTGSRRISFLNNLMSGQGNACLVINADSQKEYRGDGNVYNPVGGTAAIIAGTSYTPAQVQSKALAQAWYAFDKQDAYEGRVNGRSAHAAEARSSIVTASFVNRNAGDFRLAFVNGNVIDAGAERTPQRAIIPPVTDAQGQLRYFGNAVDAGAYETQPPSYAVFVLDADYTTSAGVYKADGTLVRTLFSGQRRAAGTNVIFWNGLTDNYTVAPSESYTIKMIAHNVTYTWEGVVGNSSNPNAGSSVHGSFEPVAAMAIYGNTAFYTAGYNESKYELYRFDTTNPNKVTKAFGPLHDIYSDAAMDLATDGSKLYTINSAQVAVYGFSSCQPTTFGNGAARINVGNGRGWIEVQRNGSLLFVSRRDQNTIYIFDKNSGAQTGSISVSQPTDLALTPSGDLWVLSGATAVRYQVSASGGSPAQTISGLNSPLAIACSPVDGTVLVAEAGTQQIKAFSASGAPVWTHGQLNGYANGPRVTPDKFYFRYENEGVTRPATYLAFQPDGSWWAGDTFVSRNLHFNMSRQLLHEIDYQPHTYNASVDINNPTRVFNRFTEYNVDYAKPLGQSWVITNFYGYNLPSYFYGFEDGVFSVVTLRNGRTYGLAYDPNKAQGSVHQIVELTANGLRETGVRNLPNYTRIEKDGSMLSKSVSGGTITFLKKTLTGFDANGNPQFSAAQSIGSAPVSNGAFTSDPAGWRSTPQLCGNMIINFDDDRTRTGFHLGAVKQGSNQWLWKASPSAGGLNGYGQFDSDCEYGGNLHYTAGRNIFYGFHGEFYMNQGQANQFMHFYDNGLFIGEFGNPRLFGVIINGPGVAGNSFAPTLVEVGSDIYLYHNEEWGRGSHRWKMEGANTIHELASALSVGQAPTGTTNTPGNSTNAAPALPVVTVASTVSTAAEGGPNGVFTISRTGLATNALSVAITWSGTAINGVDYQATTATVLLPITANSATVLISPIDDTTSEGVETVTISIASSSAYTVGSASTATININDNETQPVPVDQPDLVVVNVSATPANPQPGDKVRFTATIKNQGGRATPAETIVGVGFYVDGGTVTSWVVQPQLQPGETVTLTANDGSAGPDWTATQGTHNVVAFVDDVNRIAEAVENNNTRSLSLNVGNTPGPVATIRPQIRGRMTVSWNSVAGKVYQVCYKDALTDSKWTVLSNEITATNSNTAFTDTPPSGSPMRLYKVLVVR